MNMELYQEINVNCLEFANNLDVKNKKKLPAYNDIICNKMSCVLQTGALVVKNIDVLQHGVSNKLACSVCKKVFQFKYKWIDLKQESMLIKVFSDKTICDHPDEQRTRPVRGPGREKLAEELTVNSADTYINKQILQVDKHLLQAKGNLQTIKSPEVLWKIRSQHLAKDDLDSNDFLDIHKLAISDENAKNPLIQSVATFPFTIMVRFVLFAN